MITITPPTSQELLRRGVAAHGTGQFEDAVREYTLAAALDPRCAATLANRAAARGQLGDTAGAFADYTEALRLRPEFPEALNNRGVLRRESGDLTAALADFERAIELAPDYADARANRAVIHHLRWNHAAVVEDLTIALKAKNQPGIQEKTHLLTVFRGDAFYHLGWIENAMEDYRSVYAERPRFLSHVVCRTVATTVRDHGVEAMLADCERHLARDPRDFLTLARRAIIHLGEGRIADAEADRATCYTLGELRDAELFEALLTTARRLA